MPTRLTAVFDNAGLATEDFSTLSYVYRKLLGTGVFQHIDILADPDKPRDVFGLLQRGLVKDRRDQAWTGA